MSKSKVKGYASKSVGKPLELFTYEQPKLGEHDVRVSVTHCGVCHTDIHAVEDYYGITAFPFVPGHEIVGYITEVGSAVTGLKEGDRVGIGWQGRACMKCKWCLQGEEHLCMDIVEAGSWVPYGGFSSSVLVDNRFAYPLPDVLPSEVAAVLVCAGVAVYAPLKSYAKQLSQKIGIIGVGGLGHLAIQFAKALGYEVTAISSSPEKKEQSLDFGADHFMIASDETSLEEVAFNFDLLLCTASNNVNWKGLLNTLKKNGSMVLVGFPDVVLNSTDLVAHQLSITGSFLGNRATMKEMLSFAVTHSINPKLEVMPMSKVNEAMNKVKEGRARYRIVLVNDFDDVEG
ncbi:MAG: NAD(P)-dependent alcohol dehydrogenase [Candidatus Thorarchaeota archaeon]